MLRNWALALRPSLSLDFLAGLNDSRITYSGGANGTRIDSSGVIVAATTPRFDYDPVTLAARGLLVEEARTNLLTYSSEFDNAIWLKNSAAVAVTANATTSPDGTTNADKIYEADTSTTDREVYQTIRTITASATCTGSIYVKQAERTTCQVRITSNNGTYSTFVANINLATGAITGSGTAGGMVSGSASIQPAANGFYRVIITGVFAADVTQAGVDVYCYNGTTTNYAGAVNSGFFVWGAQFEAGSFATSYIPTTTASVTRTADSAVMTGTNFSSWFNPVQGTFVVAASAYNSVNGVFSQPSAYGVSDGTSNNFIEVSRLATSAAVRSRVTTGGASQFNSINSSWPVDVIAKVGTTYKVNDFAAVLSGGTVFTDATGTIPAVDRLQIGGLAVASIWTGHIRTLQFYPQRLPNAQLQALTS